MGLMEPRGGRTDDLSWAKSQTQSTTVRCFFCNRPGATADARLGDATIGGGTKVACCPEGQGCKDGRIYHGPPRFGSHWPDDPCDYCARSSRTATGRRVTGNSPRRTSRAVNRSPWHN